MTANKQDLKTIIKPLIRECVKEVMFESGVLAKIITEVVQGLQGSMIVENRQPQQKQPEKPKQKDPDLERREKQAREELAQAQRERKENAQKIMEATGMSKMFANIIPETEVVPIIEQKQPTKQLIIEPQQALTSEEKEELMEEKRRIQKEEMKEASLGAKGGMALRGIEPSDPGINISGILGMIGGSRTWKTILKKKESE